MEEQTGSSYEEQLLQDWSFWREMVNYYCNALMLLTPGEGDGGQRWRELSDKLATAEFALRQTNSRLRAYEEERSGARH